MKGSSPKTAPGVAPLRRKETGSFTPKKYWRHYAGNSVAPLRRKRNGSIAAKTDSWSGLGRHRDIGLALSDGAGHGDTLNTFCDFQLQPIMDVHVMQFEFPDCQKTNPPQVCTLTIIVPVFNEEAVLGIFHRRLIETVSVIPGGFEVIYIDDGSTDGTPQILAQMRAADPMVGVLRFSRNFGKEQALNAGLRHARGGAIVVIDADLQDPPELIPSMVQIWRQGVDVVNMRRRGRKGETWIKRLTAHAFYRVFNRLSEVPIPEDVGDFRLLSRRAVDALNQMPERTRFMKGLFAWIGFQQVTLDYQRDARAAGDSKWRYWRLWNFALDGITGFSTAPLKVASYGGLISAMGAFLYAVYFFIKTLTIGESVAGFPTLIITLLFLGGMQLMAVGVVGEYLGRLFIETKRRPPYLIDSYQAARIGGRQSDEKNP